MWKHFIYLRERERGVPPPIQSFGACCDVKTAPRSARKCVSLCEAGKDSVSRGVFQKVLLQAGLKALALNSWRRAAGLREELNRSLSAANNPLPLNCVKSILWRHKELNSSTSPSGGEHPPPPRLGHFTGTSLFPHSLGQL